MSLAAAATAITAISSATGPLPNSTRPSPGAIRDFSRSIDLDPAEPEGYMRRGFLLVSASLAGQEHGRTIPLPDLS
jgi:hypothetical protein